MNTETHVAQTNRRSKQHQYIFLNEYAEKIAAVRISIAS